MRSRVKVWSKDESFYFILTKYYVNIIFIDSFRLSFTYKFIVYVSVCVPKGIYLSINPKVGHISHVEKFCLIPNFWNENSPKSKGERIRFCIQNSKQSVLKILH